MKRRFQNDIPPPEYSSWDCGSTKANQSDACVGSRPILWHLYSARPQQTMLPRKNTNFCPAACVPSITLNVACVEIMAFSGRINIMPTIMMGKIEMEFPDMYIIRRFIGTCKEVKWINQFLYTKLRDLSSYFVDLLTCLIGPSAKSQDFFKIKWFWSVSLATSTWLWPIDGL